MKVITLLISLVLPLFSFAKSEDTLKKQRKYPGGWDEMEIQVQDSLPSTYKTPRRYYEAKVLSNQDGRLPASNEEE